MSDLNMDALAESHYAAQDPQFEKIEFDGDKWLENLQELYGEINEKRLALAELAAEYESAVCYNRHLNKAGRKLNRALELIEREL